MHDSQDQLQGEREANSGPNFGSWALRCSNTTFRHKWHWYVSEPYDTTSIIHNPASLVVNHINVYH